MRSLRSRTNSSRQILEERLNGMIGLSLNARKLYIVTLVVEYLGWVDLDLGSSIGWWAATVATYCPSRMVEHPKSKSTQPRSKGR